MSKKLLAVGVLSLMSLSVFAESEKDLAMNESISLMKCVRKNARKKTYEKNKDLLVNVVGSVLDQEGRLTQDVDLLTHAKQSCQSKDPTNILVFNSDQLKRAERIVDFMANPVYGCDFISVEGAVAIGLGVGVGGSIYKCHGTDASIRLYAGPRVSYGVGAGAFIVANISSNQGMMEQAPDYINPLLVENAFMNVNYSTDMLLGLVLATGGSYTSAGLGVGVGLMYRDRLDVTFRIGSLPSEWENYVEELRL